MPRLDSPLPSPSRGSPPGTAPLYPCTVVGVGVNNSALYGVGGNSSITVPPLDLLIPLQSLSLKLFKAFLKRLQLPA